MIKKNSDNAKAFLATDIQWGDYVALSKCSTNREKVYVILSIANAISFPNLLSATDLAIIISKRTRKTTTPQAIRSAIQPKISDEIEAIERDDAIIGYKLIEKRKTGNTIIVPENSEYTSKKILTKHIIEESTSELYLCDSYCGLRTLDLIASAPKSTRVKIITMNIIDKPLGIFKRNLLDLTAEGHNIEVRKYTSTTLHDRYIINEKHMWLIGHSIKDLGKKECFVTKVGNDVRQSCLSTFNQRWKSSIPV